MYNVFFNKLSLQSKILSMLLLTTLLSILLTGYLGYSSGRQALTQRAINQLISIRESKAQEIQTLYKLTENHVLTMSESTMVIDAVKEFKAAYQKLDSTKLTPEQQKTLKDFYRQQFIPRLDKNVPGNPVAETFYPDTPTAEYLQYYYIAANPNAIGEKYKLEKAKDGSEYSTVHQNYHSRFKNIADRMGYEDIYLVDIDTGTIIYNIQKEIDFGTNLKSGPHQGSHLAQAYQNTLDSRSPFFVEGLDFEAYLPSFSQPAAFMTTTVFDGNNFVGALIFQLSSKTLDNTVSSNQKWQEVGLGETGETYLVGQDLLLRSSPRLFLENSEKYFETLTKNHVSADEIKRIQNLGSPILVQQVKTETVIRALNGETGTAFYDDYRQVPVLGAFTPLRLGNFQWALVAKQDQDEIFRSVRDLTNRLIISTAILIPLFTLFSIFFARLLARPIQKLITATKKLALGDTDVRVNIKSQDEIGDLAESFNQMAQNIRTKEQMLKQTIAENERLLLNILPAPIAKRLQSGETQIADNFPNVTVMYAEIEGFSEFSQDLTPDQAVALLNELINSFDETADLYGVEKLKTFSESYLAVCGLTVPRIDHTKRMIDFGQAMLQTIRRFNQKQGCKLNLDIGIHSGPVFAGVVGKIKFIYEIWGETMTVATAIHASPERDVIRVSQSVYDALKGLYHFKRVKDVEIEGKGKIPVWSVYPLDSSLPSKQSQEVQHS
jgi:class 3 adenylate cyclase